MQNSLVNQLIRKKSAMAESRQPCEKDWRDCFDYSFPERGDGLNGEKIDDSSLQAKQARLLDGTATDSCQILASALMGGGTPSNSRWFGFSSGNDTEEEKAWYDEAAEIIYTNIHASNYDAVGYECCLDMVAAGWFVLFIDEKDEGGYHFEEWPLASCYISASRPGGPADTLVRNFEMTAEQAVSFYNKRGDTLSDKVRKMVDDGKGDQKVKFCLAIYPRSGASGIRAKNLPFASIHWEEETKKQVRESGYHECPFVAPRWSKRPNSDYAVGPMFRALPDTKQLNRLVYLEDANFDMAVCGTFIAEDDGVLNPRTVKLGARTIIVANSVDSIKPLATGGNFQLSFTKKEQLQAAIRKILMADQLAPQDGPVRTAYETHVRVQMIRQLLGPIYGRLQPEWYTRMIDRCGGLALRAGILPQPPQSLVNKSFSATFQSPNAKAQKLEEVTAIESTIVSVGQIAAAKGDPTVWDNIDTDEATRIIRDGRGAPAKIMRKPEDVATIRKNREEAQQQAVQAERQHEMTQTMMPAMAKQMANA